MRKSKSKKRAPAHELIVDMEMTQNSDLDERSYENQQPNLVQSRSQIMVMRNGSVERMRPMPDHRDAYQYKCAAPRLDRSVSDTSTGRKSGSRSILDAANNKSHSPL